MLSERKLCVPVPRSNGTKMALLIVSVVILTVGLADAKPAVKHYASKYDHIDVETILNNPRMVKYYSACLLSQGPCPPEGVEFKSKSL